MPILTPGQLAVLAAIDSPTVANAIERFRVRRRIDGYADRDLRCAFPQLGTMVGYAVTCTADSTTEGRSDGAGLIGLWAALEAAPKPAVLVIKDVGPDPRKGCHMGEIMATIAKTLGAVGCVSDSSASARASPSGRRSAASSTSAPASWCRTGSRSSST